MFVNYNDFNTSIFELQELIDDRKGLVNIHIDDLFKSDGWDIEFKFNRSKELMGYRETLTKISSTLEKVEALWNRIGDDIGEEGADYTTANDKTKLRTIQIEITDGMIRNSMLTLTGAIRHGLAKLGDEFLITLPNGDKFKTFLVSPGNRLKERKRIREFYKNENILPGDKAVMIETSAGEWNLKKDELPDFHELGLRPMMI